MDVMIVPSHQDLAELGASLIAQLLIEKPSAVLGLATGSTPIAIYQHLVRLRQSGDISFKEVTTFNLDEYVGLSPKNAQSYSSFMRRELFDQVDVDLEKTHLPVCSNSQNPRAVGKSYEALIQRCGGIDLQILGIGSNGHIGFNEPGSSLSSRTRIKTLTESTVKDNSRLFKSTEFQPRLAMTMGIRTILDARRVLLFASGEKKARAVHAAVEGPLTASCPASSLQLHERATLVVDEAAARDLEHSAYYRWSNEQNKTVVSKYGFFHELTDW